MQSGNRCIFNEHSTQNVRLKATKTEILVTGERQSDWEVKIATENKQTIKGYFSSIRILYRIKRNPI